MNEDYIPHQNLEDPSNIINESKMAANNIYNNNTDIKQQIINQNEYINDLKNEMELNDINDKIECNNIGNNVSNAENLKLTIYQKLSITSNELMQAREHIKYLTQENNNLKNIIANKNKIISDFEQLLLQFKERFEKLELINMNLKQQLNLKNPGGNQNQKNINDHTYNYNYNFNYKSNITKDINDYNNNLNEYKNINDYNNLNEYKDMNNYRDLNEYNDNNQYRDLNNYNKNNNEYKYNKENNNLEEYNNNMCEYNFSNIPNNDELNYNLQLKNNELINIITNIKRDLDLIENDYQMQLKEKDCYIEQINCELVNVYKEYVKLSDILEELNYLVKNSDYNELKTEFNCLLREKEILLKQKEKDHMEIITLREKFLKKPYDCRDNGEEDKQCKELIKIFNETEENYKNEIDNLKQNLTEKINEIEELKKRHELIIREYESKIENMLKNGYQLN